MSMKESGPIIIPRGEPFYFPGNEIGCLLVHGFTDSALEMRPFGEYLSEQGYTVHGIRITGHATHINDLKRSRWQDLLASVEDGFHLLKSNQNVKKIIIIGHSMGGALTLIASSYLPVDGTVVMAPASQLSSDNWWSEYRAAFSVFWGSLMRKWKSRNLPERLPGWYWYEPELSRGYIKYNQKPFICNLQLVRLANKAWKEISKIKSPVLLMGSRNDNLIDPTGMEELFQKITADQKELVWFEKSSHMLPVDGERDLVFERTNEFIKNVVSNS